MSAEKKRFVGTLLILGGWTAFGLFFGMQNYVRDVYFGKNANMGGYIIGWLMCGYSWAILTMPVLWLARSSLLDRLSWPVFFAVQVPAGLIFSLFQLGIYDTIAHLLFGAGGFGFGEYYGYLLANELQSSFLAYFAMIAAVTAYDHFFAGKTETPVVESTFGQSVSAESRIEAVASPTNGNINGQGAARRISVKENGRILLLDVDEIDWITSEGNYVQLHTPKKKYLVRETMNNMESKLDSHEFVRLRRSTIVRVGEIKEFHPTFNGEFEVLLKSGIKLASSRRYRKNLEHLLNA